MKTFKEYISEIAMSGIDAMRLLNRAKMSQQDKNEIAKKTGDEVERRMIKKYQLPTKVV